MYPDNGKFLRPVINVKGDFIDGITICIVYSVHGYLQDNRDSVYINILYICGHRLI